MSKKENLPKSRSAHTALWVTDSPSQSSENFNLLLIIREFDASIIYNIILFKVLQIGWS